MFNLRYSNDKGFSLIEMMIVVAIISLLAAIGIPQYSKFKQKAHDSEAKSLLSSLFVAEKSFFSDYNFYHTSLEAIGFGSEGKHFYNVGFATASALTPTDYGFHAPVNNAVMAIKQQCVGANAIGADTGCRIMVDVPDIPAEATADQYEFYAAAVSTPALYAQNESQNPMVTIVQNVVFEQSAHAQVIPLPLPPSPVVEPLDCSMRTNRVACANPNNWFVSASSRLWVIDSTKTIKAGGSGLGAFVALPPPGP